jgi:prephenate dehydrogenase
MSDAASSTSSSGADGAASPQRRANVIGSGLIGGSVGLALRGHGWHVSVTDADPSIEQQALNLGVADAIGLDPDAELTVVAAPVGAIPDLVAEALAATSGIVTDVGSTKAEICSQVLDPRFVGGHPMAGSDQDGVDGATADLFSGAMWVLTPNDATSEVAFATVRSAIRSFGAESIALPPSVHDELVAQVSHVPHLTSAALMNLAAGSSVEHRPLLRLAAGGFRDMTRISAGRPAIWPDICIANREAIVVGLDQLIDALANTRSLVADGDRAGLYALLDSARTARINLPVGYGQVEAVSELAVPIPDRPGEIAAIATLAAELDVNILDLDITHSGEGKEGIMMLMVDATKAERLVGGLMARGYRPTLREL